MIVTATGTYLLVIARLIYFLLGAVLFGPRRPDSRASPIIG